MSKGAGWAIEEKKETILSSSNIVAWKSITKRRFLLWKIRNV
jgi:hypothetical protein